MSTTSTPTLPRSVEQIRAEFPILARRQNGLPIAYLDSAASAQRPVAVIEAVDRYSRHDHANVHRGVYELSERATELYEAARGRVAAHIGAGAREVVFTSNATEAINLVAFTWGRAKVGAGDRILVTEMEHHANLVPWQMLCAETGAELDWIPIDADGRLDLAAYRALLEREPRLVAVAHVSNVLGTLNPVAEITRAAREAGAVVLLDGAQAAPKLPVDVGEIGADFYVFTGHKLYGPTGIGVLWGRYELLFEMPPFCGGGGMIRKVTKEGPSWADPPARFEAGTPPICEAVGLGAAIDWLAGLGLEAIHAHERELAAYALERLGEVPGFRVLGPPAGGERIGPISFELAGVHGHDIAEIVDRHAICVRAGHHCAHPLMDRLGVRATARASFAVHTTSEEIDRLVSGLHDVRRIFAL